MKLIDLLVKELPKRGGWPDGAVECQRFVDEATIDFYDENGNWDEDGNWDDDCSLTYGSIAVELVRKPAYPCESEQVTRNQYESALAASQRPAWNGEGLPPVGCECEYISNGTSWGKVKVIGFDGEKIVIRPSGEIYYAITPSNKDVFIPLRTEADKKRDAALDAIYGAIASAKREHNRSDEADEVYKAIAAGKIPGVKLDD